MHPAHARLRAKTDHELSILAVKQFHRSRNLARQGAYRAAAKDFLSARALLQVANLPDTERARLEALMAEARKFVELPVTAVA